jgi:iron complex outermembrane recepter protein
MTPVAIFRHTVFTETVQGEGSMSCRFVLHVALVLSIAGWRSNSAVAQSPPNDDGQSRAQLEEVVVTANKRAESIQDVPSSVIAVTADTLERANVRTFDGLVNVVPSITISKTTQPANNSINIRGIGTYAYSIATQPSTVVVVDDIPQAFQAEAFTSLVDVQQVEVLRGPQSTLFGKSASAGVVNITTRGPSDTFTAHADAMGTNDDEQVVQAAVSGPVSDTLKYRISAGYNHYKGNLHNLTTGAWLDGQQDQTLRGNIMWQPASGWTVTWLPYMIDTVASCCAAAPYFISPGVTFSKSNLPVALILQGITPSSTNTWLRNDVNSKGNAYDIGSGFKIVRDFDNGMSLASISSYDHYTLHDQQDTDGTSYDYSLLAPTAPHGGSGNGGYFTVNGVTEELRLTSPSTGTLKYVAGGYFSNSDTKAYFVRGSNNLGTYNGLSSLPTTNSSAYASYIDHAGIKTEALYGQATYALTDRLSVVGGLRLHHEQVRYDFWDQVHNVYYGTPDCSTKSPTVPISTCNSDTVVTYKSALEYHLTPDLMVFTDYATGYKGLAYDLTSSLTTRSLVTSGPFTGIPVADSIAARQPIRPERSRDYEVGFKGAFLDHRVTWNVTGFYEEFTGFQAQSRDEVTGVNELESIGKVTSAGVETELAARPIPEVTLSASGSYDVAKMVDFPAGQCYASQTVAQGCVGQVQNLSGKPLPNAPKWSGNLNGEYEQPLGAGYSAFVALTYRWQSQVIFNLLQDPDSVQRAYGIFNLSTGFGGEHWRATVFVNNLFDTHYALNRGRATSYNLNRTVAPFTDAINWTPARDSFRYEGLRFSVFY